MASRSRRHKSMDNGGSGAHAAWCCISSGGLTSSPLPHDSAIAVSHRPSTELPRKSLEKHRGRAEECPAKVVLSPLQAVHQQQKVATGGGVKKAERPRRSAELDKAAGPHIKQGFISGGNLDRSATSSPFKIRLSPPGRVSPMVDTASSPTPVNYENLNALLSTGLLTQPSPSLATKRASTTPCNMSAYDLNDQDRSAGQSTLRPPVQDRILSAGNIEDLFNDSTSCDVRLSLCRKEGSSITISAHSQILTAKSRFFAVKLSERQSTEKSQLPYHIQISDCEDLEIYVDTLRLMYCTDLKKKLVKQNVTRVLAILKVCTTIVFEAGVLSCLEYLEAVPWPEEDEQKVTALLSQLQLESIGVGEVLKRLSVDEPSGSEDVLVGLVQLVTKGTDEKARREMKSLVSRMLRENAAQGKDLHDLSKDSLYQSCQGCLDSLSQHFRQASSTDFVSRLSEDRGVVVAQIIRQADNLNWLAEILIDRQIADDFVKTWAVQTELAMLHGKVPLSFGRYEVSRLTARICIALGRGQVLAPKDVRFMLLQNWLQPLIDDFGWMQRVCRELDKNVVEDGISQTILTLSLKEQQTIMLSWFDRFLKNGDDCPNLQRAFEIWWRRTFVRPPLDLVRLSD